uniref:Uncharacterized protein n=1 Tax=Rhizophora mucronata TaxID=61149 RepID=A0A2P2PM44_RHIMU
MQTIKSIHHHHTATGKNKINAQNIHFCGTGTKQGISSTN